MATLSFMNSTVFRTPLSIQPRRWNPIKPSIFVLKTRYGNKERLSKHVKTRAGVDISDRAIGSASYLLPLMDGLRYGTYLFQSYPIFERLLSPVFPLYNFYASFPFGTVIVFFAVYFGIARNQYFNRFVRFNTYQALLIDILLILPGFLVQVFQMSQNVRVPIFNVTWMYVFLCTIIGIASCIAGTTTRLPLVAEASDAQVDR